jgi:hypothetical protein
MSLQRIDSDALQKEIFANLEPFLQCLYPNGSLNRHKHQFFIGDLEGNGGKSTKINLIGEHKGVAYDWQTHNATADWVAIWMKNNRVTFRVACEQICEAIGVPLSAVNEMPRFASGDAEEENEHISTSTDKAPAPPQITWPNPDYLYVDDEVCNSISLYDLTEKSPISFEDANDNSVSETVIDALFPGSPLLCVGKAANVFCTRRRETLRGHLGRCQFIVPNPMRSWRGLNADGNQSERCADNVGAREFLVIECDFTKEKLNKTTGEMEPTKWMPSILKWESKGISVADACAALLWDMSRHLPLVMVVSSGGKSLHGWFRTCGLNERDLLSHMKAAVRIGADPATWRPFQLVRMPGGTRDTGARQSVLYFNPKARFDCMQERMAQA